MSFILGWELAGSSDMERTRGQSSDTKRPTGPFVLPELKVLLCLVLVLSDRGSAGRALSMPVGYRKGDRG